MNFAALLNERRCEIAKKGLAEMTNMKNSMLILSEELNNVQIG